MFVYNADDLDKAHGRATVTAGSSQLPTPAAVCRDGLRRPQSVPGYTTCADGASIDGWHQMARSVPSRTSRRLPATVVRNLPGVLEGGRRLWHEPFLAATGPLAVQYRDQERLRGEAAAE